MALQSIARVRALEVERMLFPHLGLADEVHTAYFLANAAHCAKESAEEIARILREGGTKEQALAYYRNKFYRGKIKEGYPIDAMLLNTTIPDAMSAMMGGSVDCALLAGAAAYNTQAGGAHLVTNGDGLVEASICCAATKEFCDANPELVESFLKAQEEVLSFMAGNEETALAEAAEFLDLDIAAVRDMYAYYDFDMTIRDSDIAAMQSTVQFMLDSGMIEESVDISSIVRR
jgi:hypothetical protein